MTRKQITLAKFLVISLTAISLSGCIIHVGGKQKGDKGGVSSVFGSVEVSEGKSVADVSSVNGGIELHNNVVAQQVDTVNGDIEIGANVTVENANTVNGSIDVRSDFKSFGDVETVNGDISIQQDSEIQGSVKTINGDIKLNGVLVSKDVITKNGDVTLRNSSIVYGDLIYESQNQSNSKSYRFNRPELKIEKGSQVLGNIILRQKVDLDIEDPELLEKVQHNYSDK
jgi:DUF4097 and DUF4098 domain-containing protein YvlB